MPPLSWIVSGPGFFVNNWRDAVAPECMSSNDDVAKPNSCLFWGETGIGHFVNT
jgi:hypothetical protein